MFRKLYPSEGLKLMRELACGYENEEHHGQREKQVQGFWGKSLIVKLNIQKGSHWLGWTSKK